MGTIRGVTSSGKPSPVPSGTPVEWLIDAFEAAFERLHRAIEASGADAQSTFAPLLECLTWAGSIEMAFREAGRDIGSDLLSGVAFARGRVHHQWAQAIRREEVSLPTVIRAGGRSRRGGGAIIIRPASTTVWAWLDAASLPAPTDKRHENPVGMAHYVANVGGKNVVATLAELSAVLEQLR